MLVTINIKHRMTGARDEPTAESDHLQVEAENYEDAKSLIRARLPAGWIMGSWWVGR